MKKIIQSKFFRLVLSVGIAYLLYVICPACFSKTTIAVLLIAMLVIINIFPFFQTAKGIMGTMYYWLTQISRIAVGGLFIFSGFIKANDPLGFSYKLEEYFEVFKADTGFGFFEWFAHISLPIAIIICVSEMALGFMLLVGFKRKLTLWLLLAQIVFFTFLTFYSACFNKVTHCGCFGDFIKLTPWESFGKDIALLILIAILFIGEESINELFNPMLSLISTVLAIGVSTWFPIHTWKNLPLFDFRAYAPGLSICEGMKKGPNHKDAVYKTMLVYTNLKTGKDEEFTQDKYPWQDTLTWKFKEMESKVVTPEIEPSKIPEFKITDLDGNDVTDSILKNNKYNFYIVCYDLAKTNEGEELHAKINDFYTLCKKDGINVIALTSAGYDQINEYKHKHNALYDFYTVDGIVLKTMIRSNPGLMLMNDCKVVANWHYNNWPIYSDVKNKLINAK